MLELAAGVLRNTDDNMRIEHSAPLHLNTDTTYENTVLLRGVSQVPFEAVDDGSRSLVKLAAAYMKDGDLGRALIVLRAAEASNPDDPEIAALAASPENVMGARFAAGQGT